MTEVELNAFCAGLEHAADCCDAYAAGSLGSYDGRPESRKAAQALATIMRDAVIGQRVSWNLRAAATAGGKGDAAK